MPRLTVSATPAQRARLLAAVTELRSALAPWADALKAIEERGSREVDLSQCPVLARFVEICRRYA